MVHRSRPRNAATTRAAILDAAREQFSREGYDDVGMRDIARQVGVDAAMVSRYFGSKEELYRETLLSCSAGSRSLIDGARDSFGRDMAHQLVYEPANCAKLNGMAIMLRAQGSTRAAEVVRQVIFEEFLGPFETWLGGERAHARARLASSLVMGFAVNRNLVGDDDLDEADKALMYERLADLLQRAVAD